MTYLYLALARTLGQEGKSDTMVASVAISVLLFLQFPWLAGDEDLYHSNLMKILPLGICQLTCCLLPNLKPEM